MPQSRRSIPALGFLGALALAACHDTTAPPAVDTTAFASGFTEVNSSFTGNAAFQSLVALPGVLGLSDATAALGADVARRWNGFTAAAFVAGGLGSRVGALRQIGVPLRASVVGSGGARALFPSDALGKTYVWDPTRGAYVQSTLTGAPANGVRFLLYVIDPATETPALPLRELGYLDLTDRSSGHADTLGVVVALGTATVADYVIAGSSSLSSFTLTAAGYLVGADGKGRVDFSLSDEVGDFQTGAVVIGDHVSAANGFTVDLAVSGAPPTLQIDYTVAQGRNSIELVGTAGGGGTSADVKYNGVKVATLTRTTDGLTFTGVNGHKLSQEETTALGTIFRAAGELLVALQNVFAPGFLIF